MSEFKELLKEAFAGAEPFDEHPGQDDLRQAVSRFEQRDLIVRILGWTAVTLATAAVVWSVYAFFTAPDDASARTLLVPAVVFIWGMSAIGWMKGFIFIMQNHLASMKELKRIQLLLAEAVLSKE